MPSAWGHTRLLETDWRLITQESHCFSCGSVKYLDDTQVGKTGEHTDTYHGRFMELKPYEKIVEELQFESAEESLKNRMTLTFLLEEIEEGTKLTVIHEGLPESISMKDNELGWLEALEQLRVILQLE